MVFIPTPLKNDGLRQLGWWHSQHMEKIMFQTTNQICNLSLTSSWKNQDLALAVSSVFCFNLWSLRQLKMFAAAFSYCQRPSRHWCSADGVFETVQQLVCDFWVLSSKICLLMSCMDSNLKVNFGLHLLASKIPKQLPHNIQTWTFRIFGSLPAQPDAFTASKSLVRLSHFAPIIGTLW